MTLQEQYTALLKLRKQQPVEIINNKKRMAWEYFRKLVLVNNLEQNLSRRFSLFYAPVKQIRGSNMTCWPLQDGSTEIYIDEEFALKNPKITSIQSTHEVLHGLSQMKDDNQYFFNHLYQANNQSVYSGIDEATTQLFAEDIEQYRLNEDEDYLYFIKNIMRVMKVIIGVDKLANQYLNNNDQFEQEFNKLTNGRFNSFVSIMNDIYKLSKKNHYAELNDTEMQFLNTRKQQMAFFAKSFIDAVAKVSPQLTKGLCLEIQDSSFLNEIGVEHNNIKNDYEQQQLSGSNKRV